MALSAAAGLAPHARAQERAPAAAGPRSAAELRADGERLRRDQRLPEALTAYRALAASDSAVFEDRFWLAKLEAWTGDLGAAERDLTLLLAERPADYDSRIALADLRRWQGDTAGARALLDDLRRAHPDDPEVLGRLAALRRSSDGARWEADLQYLGERLPGGATGDGATVSLRSLPPRPVAWRAAVTVQDKFDRTETRAGGELGVRLGQSLRMTGTGFVAPGAEVLPRASWGLGLGGPVARGVVLAADYGLDHYGDARVHGPGASIELYAGHWLLTGRYRYVATRFDGSGTTAGEHAGTASVGWLYGSANLVRLFAGAGGEAFSGPSRDRIGRFTAHTAGVAWRHWIMPAVGLEAVYARQDRSDGGRQHTYGLRVVRRW